MGEQKITVEMFEKMLDKLEALFYNLHEDYSQATPEEDEADQKEYDTVRAELIQLYKTLIERW